MVFLGLLVGGIAGQKSRLAVAGRREFWAG